MLEWPSKLPDLNPVEHIFGSISRKFYQKNQRYHSRSVLWNAIKDTANKVALNELKFCTQVTNKINRNAKKGGSNTR